MKKNTGDRLEFQANSIFREGYGNISKLVMRSSITIGAKGLYAYFCSFSGAGGQAFPARNTIISDLKINKDTYYKYLKELVSAGYITVINNVQHNLRGDGERFLNNTYIVNTEVAPCPKKPDTEKPCLVLPDTVPPDTVKPDTNNNIINNKDRTGQEATAEFVKILTGAGIKPTSKSGQDIVAAVLRLGSSQEDLQAAINELATHIEKGNTVQKPTGFIIAKLKELKEEGQLSIIGTKPAAAQRPSGQSRTPAANRTRRTNETKAIQDLKEKYKDIYL